MASITSFLTLIVILFLLWLPQAVYQVVVWTYWLQVKEYRYDRFWIFIKSIDGWESLGFPKIILKILGIFTSVISLWIPVVIFLYLDLILLNDFYSKKIRKPDITERIRKIWLSCIFGIAVTFVLVYLFLINAFLIGETLLILTPLLGILWTIPLVNKAKRLEIEKTNNILEKYKPVVIGITGSYGKTTTKDFITQLLSTKYPVLSTYKNQNTHFGILRRINNDLTKEYKFFIAEVGAYKKGEIEEIAEILKPNAVLLTGIEAQHLELFGNFENLKEAKFEMVKSLEPGGLAFFNVSDPIVDELVIKAKHTGKKTTVYTYAAGRKGRYDASSQIKSINANQIVFTINVGNEKKEIKTNIVSKSLIENLTGAILVARVYGVSWPEIILKSQNLSLPESTLNVFEIKGGITVIDDSYNSSSSGFEAALEMLNLIKGKRKFVATTGIIELGWETNKVHKKIGKILDEVADFVLLRNRDFEKPLREGMTNKYKLILMTDPKKMVTFFRDNIKESDVVLIEGKLPLVIEHFMGL